MDPNFYSAYSQGYRDAEDVARQLHMRFMKDWEKSDGMQTVGDLKELATTTLVSLLFKRVGIPAFKIEKIVNTSAVMWLEEVALKKLLFFLLIMGKGEEAFNMRTAIQMRFGYPGEEIVGDALRLAKEFTDATRRRDFNRITEIFRQTSVASSQQEQDRNKFIF